MTYLDETTRVIRWYEDPDCLEIDQDDSWLDDGEQTGVGDSICSRGVLSSHFHDAEITSDGSPSFSDRQVPSQAATPASGNHNRALPLTTLRTETSTTHGSPETTSSRSYSTIYPLSVTSGPQHTVLTQREAALMRNFTDNMALWVFTPTPVTGSCLDSAKSGI